MAAYSESGYHGIRNKGRNEDGKIIYSDVFPIRFNLLSSIWRIWYKTHCGISTKRRFDVSWKMERSIKSALSVYEAQAPVPWNRHVYASPAGVSSFIPPSLINIHKEPNVLKTDQCLTCLLSNCSFQGKSSVSPGKDLFIDFSCNGAEKWFDKMKNIIFQVPVNFFKQWSHWIAPFILLNWVRFKIKINVRYTTPFHSLQRS